MVVSHNSFSFKQLTFRLAKSIFGTKYVSGPMHENAHINEMKSSDSSCVGEYECRTKSN